ncbi:hypothetical protein MMAD_53470 [Mycolicibacterium madagascariense]|uniref:ESX-1 secretion-associated protein EspB n=1 Tax=Mycolicibacterium madagascariense TaxID=212765 RepID=A0A7I7XPV7_9MYCO|nr:PPE domain-containing protein [Mycolicibacterium madagascariense]MCV7014027.1 PPE domain-containing protein [Mycolicibacterium madagascariense]BBZ31052.1 hypothetical protein MMAD_53470 [Mycolicibacterium madagascariense]
MGGGIDVDTEDLRTRASEVANVELGDAETLVPDLRPPDALASTHAAVALLRLDADYLVANQAYGQVEAFRLAETLRSVADAYDRVDEGAKRSLDGTGPPPEPVVPESGSIPEPMAPPSPEAAGLPPGEEALHVDVAQQRLSDGDHGVSLQTAAAAWYANGVRLGEAAASMQAPIRHWEGAAATAAYEKLVRYGAWLAKLGQAWQQLAAEAHRIVDAHLAATGAHTPVYQQYETLLADVGLGNQVSAMTQMEQLQHQSEHIRADYANSVMPQRITGLEPPTPVGDGPAAGNTGRRPSPASGGAEETGANAQGGVAGSMGRPVVRGSSPQRQKDTSPPAPPPGGEHPTGAGGQGSPTGGGPPSGALPTGDVASHLGRDDSAGAIEGPMVRPAAAESGMGGGGGGSGGSAAGSIPSPHRLGDVSAAISRPPQVPLSPGLGETPPPGGMPLGGGVGGAPMHGQGAGGAREKRRTPGLSPDEALYVEDRDYTEEVIGARRRRTVQDPKDSK